MLFSSFDPKLLQLHEFVTKKASALNLRVGFRFIFNNVGFPYVQKVHYKVESNVVVTYKIVLMC